MAEVARRFSLKQVVRRRVASALTAFAATIGMPASILIGASATATPCFAAATSGSDSALSAARPPETPAVLSQPLPAWVYDAPIPGRSPSDTAVYDISAHVVVMPDGARLEAHSGLHERVDDPRFVREHMRGATPPALYELAPRKFLFHGVAALRLTPVTGDVFGRTGLLTHTYMLRGRPESNGCVVFRDYDAFLRAFREGRVKRLRVVPSVGEAALRIASRDASNVGD